jgi:hypothetical protein
MANNLSAFNPTMMAGNIQEILDKAHVGRSLCSFGMEAFLTKGTTVQRPYIGNLVASDYVDASGATEQSIAPTQETLVVNKEKEVDFYVSRADLVQNKFSTSAIYTKRAAYALKDVMDSDILAEIANASKSLTKADLAAGGTGDIVVTTSNVIEVFAAAYQKLAELNVADEGDLVAVVTPAVFSIIQQKATGVGFNTADKVINNGKVGSWMNFEIVVSNNIYTETSTKHLVFAKKGCIDVVVQSEPLVDEQPVKGRTGKNYLVTDLYGIKTFNTGKSQMVDVQTTF